MQGYGPTWFKKRINSEMIIILFNVPHIVSYTVQIFIKWYQFGKFNIFDFLKLIVFKIMYDFMMTKEGNNFSIVRH